MLDPLNEYHLWALHYVFIPIINKALSELVNSWNNHPVRTVGYKSLQQLFTAGALLLQHSQLTVLDFFDNVDDDYGSDPDGPIPTEEEESGISVPETTLTFLILTWQSYSRVLIHAAQQKIMELYEQTLQYSFNTQASQLPRVVIITRL